ncbi:MAG: kelch repeat-containing protein [bacterium]
MVRTREAGFLAILFFFEGLAVQAELGDSWRATTTSAPWERRDRHVAIAFDQRLFVLGGWWDGGGPLNDVWSSTEGRLWTQTTAPWQARADHQAVVFDGKLWIVGGQISGGFKNDVWFSENGTSWTLATTAAPWTARAYHRVVVHDGKLFLLGGIDPSVRSDVWQSADGVSWAQVTASAPWGPRELFSATTFNGKIWVLGGIVSTSRVNDVWSSDNGVTWILETAGASWPARASHECAVMDGKIWLLGGERGAEGPQNDVWCSADGTSWTLATSAAAWADRFLHACAVFDRRLWVVGGNTIMRVNDVWFSGPDEPNYTLYPVDGSLDFGTRDVAEGASPPQSFTLYNDGFAPLEFSSCEMSGPGEQEFLFTSSPDLSPLAPGTSRSFSLVFDPTFPGLKQVLLRLYVNDPDVFASLTLNAFATGTTGTKDWQRYE